MSSADVGLSPSDLTEDWIREVAQRRDRAAFAQLFHHFAPRLKAYLLKMGLSEGVAEELTQETMLAVWRKAGYFDPGRASAAAWVYTIARNLRIDALRRERTPSDLRLLDAPDGPATPEQELRSFEGERRVRLALDAMPADQAELLRLSYFEEQSHAEIAHRLGIPLGTVKSRLRRAAANLRIALEGTL